VHPGLAGRHYIDWFNHQRLFEACGDIPPAELETAYYRQNTGLATSVTARPPPVGQTPAPR